MALALIWGLYFLAPTPIKLIFSAGMWASIFTFPFVLIKHNDFSKWGNILLRACLLMTTVQIARTIFNTDAAMNAFGNKWITLFGNEYTALLLMPPLFTYLGTLKYNVVLLKKATWIYLVAGIVCIFGFNNSLGWIAIYGVVFYPYVDKHYRALLLIAVLEGILSIFVTRMFVIITAFIFASYLLVYVINKPRWNKFFVTAVAISPLILFVPMLHITKELTPFEKLSMYLSNKTDDTSISADTRTFLYVEMASDLTNNHAWLIGKGAFSHYYSLFFDQSSMGKYGRITSEVPFLNHLLRGGILYVLAYYGLILLAVYKSTWQGNNKFVRSIGIIAVGWYLNSFVGDITGCRFYHIAFFLLIGCCLSRKWLNYTDMDIKKIMKK
ncbi:hypothetical protein [uncultured Bacteroides sp.]|nr:hypothetical protein [uncultured Bacteroides sp.]